MPKHTDEYLMEVETHIRWDALDKEAHLWTADPKVRKQWEEAGYEVKNAPAPKTWSCRVPADRIAYKTLKKC